MTKPEMLAEIERVSGKATRLQAVRATLPTARARRSRRGLDRSRSAAINRGQPAPVAGAWPGGRGRGRRGALTHPQRLTVIDQAVVMLETLYAHLPLKRALHAIDPLQRLRLLRLRHEALDEREFQSEMIDIFVALRDLHTNYILPTIYHRKYRVPAVPRRGVLRRPASGSTSCRGSRRATPTRSSCPASR